MITAKAKLARIAELPPTNVSGIYKIVRRDTGRVYSGQAICIRSRWLRHIKELEAGIHPNSALQKDWSSLGLDAFYFEIVARVPVNELDAAEQRAIDSTTKPYNVCVVDLSARGVKRSAETKARLKASLQKRMNDPDVIAKLRAAAAERKAAGGYIFSEEQKAKFRTAKLGKKHNHGAAIGDALRGRTHNHGHKISETLKKRPPHSEERRRKISATLLARNAKK